MSTLRPKFDDCKSCVFYLKKTRNPICGECDSGEFYEERVRVREKTNHELMEIYGKDYDDE